MSLLILPGPMPFLHSAALISFVPHSSSHALFITLSTFSVLVLRLIPPLSMLLHLILSPVLILFFFSNSISLASLFSSLRLDSSPSYFSIFHPITFPFSGPHSSNSSAFMPFSHPTPLATLSLLFLLLHSSPPYSFTYILFYPSF